MKLILWLLPAGIGVFLVILLSVYALNNPSDRAASKVAWPYALIEKPYLVQQAGSMQLTVSMLEDGMTLNGTSLRVIDPAGNQYFKAMPESRYITLDFPNDFSGASVSANGNYTVILYWNSTKPILTSSSFLVVQNPGAKVIIDFVLGSGLAVTIGLIASLITLIYQIGSQSLADRRNEQDQKNQITTRKLNDQAKWMLENLKYYLDLGSVSQSISKTYGEAPYPYPAIPIPNAQEIAFYEQTFYRSFERFREKTGSYYFDDLSSERFISALDGKIFEYLDAMCVDYSQLKQFFSQVYYQIIVDPKFKALVILVDKWLNTGDNARNLFAIHLLHHWVMYIQVNKALSISYTDEDAVRTNIERGMSLVKPTLQRCLADVNLILYGAETTQYYKLFDERGNIIWRTSQAARNPRK